MTTADGGPLRLLRHALAWGPLLLLVVGPVLSFLAYGFFSVDGTTIVRTPTLANYARIVTDPIYLPVFARSCALAAAVAALSVLLALPVAILLWSLRGTLKYALALLFLVPLLMSYIIKIYAMRAILGGNGFLNRALQALGLADGPSTLFVFNLNAVLLTLVALLIPFAILPIFLSLERLPRNLMEASADLGGRPRQTLRHVVLPLAMPGIAAGAGFTFVLAIGDFVTPQMVGGTSGFTFARIVFGQFGTAFNWPFGAALAVLMIAAVLAAMALAARAGRPPGTTA